MYLKEFENILQSECANCTISFKNNRRRKNLQCSNSTSLQFENADLFLSPSQDITNFQALSYIYRVSPDLLERSIKKHLKVVVENQNGSPTSSSQTGKDDKENSRCDTLNLNAVNLTLCQKCSRALAELYSVHYKFEKLSKENSIIAKGVAYLKENLELEHQIKLENDDDHTDIPISNNDCNGVDNWDEQLTENHEEEQIQNYSDSIKDEPLESDYEFAEPDRNDEDNCQNEEEIEEHVHSESADHGIRVRSSKIRANKRLAAFASVRDEESVVNEKTEDSEVTFSSASSEDSDIDWSTSNENNSSKKKKKLSKTRNKFVGTKESPNGWERNLEFGEALSLNEVADDKIKNIPGPQRPLKFGGNSLRCVECKVYFPDLNKFLIHHRIYHNLVWKDYSALENWWKLFAKHNYNCDICDEFFISKIDLDMHFLSHDPAAGSNYECNDPIKGPPFLCPKCENSSHLFENWIQLQEHGRLIHKIAFLNQVLKTAETKGQSGRYNSNSFFCKECSVPFALGKAWKKHMITLHPDSIICDKCNESFSDEASLQLHIAGHDSHVREIIRKDLRRFSCKDCDKTFRSNKNLWMHRFFHIAEETESDSNPDVKIKNFEEFVAALDEDVIPDATIYKSSSLMSADVSNAADIFCCAKCGKGFKSFYSKKIHQLTHFIKDLDSLEVKTLSGSEFICPKCGIDFKRNIMLREHCLSVHSILISTKAYPGDKFLQELKKENNDCIKFFSNLGLARSFDEENSLSTNVTTELTEGDPLPNNMICNVTREDLKLKCIRCDKVFKSLHSKSIHDQAQSINFSTLTKEVLSGPELKCTRCGIDFEKIGMLRKHCLKEHNLIISPKSAQGDEFLEILLKEKKHCENKSKTSANTEGKITETNKSSAIGNDKIKQFSNACKICGKVCPSYRQKKIHETLHTLDLSKVEMEYIKGTNFACPRCGQGFSKNYLLREHCLKSHNVIASTKSCPGEKFLKQLRQEQQSFPANHSNYLQCSSGSAEPDSNVNDYISPDANPEETSNNTPDPDIKTELEINTEEQESVNFQNSRAVVAEPATSQVSSLETDSFICSICSRHFSTQFNRSVHVLSHFEWEDMDTLFVKGFPFVCPTCGLKHRTMMLLREHCVTQHGFNVSNEKECKSLLRRRRKHGQQFVVPKFRKILPKPSQSNIESITDGQFFNQDPSHVSAISKRITSTAESSLVCEVCDRVCSTSNNKYEHVLTHFEWETMEVKTIFGPPYNCPNCKNQYSTFVSVRAHCVSVHGFNANTKLPKKFSKLRTRYLNLPRGHQNKSFQNVTKESETDKEMESQKNISEKIDVNLLTNESDSLTCSICSRTLANQDNKSKHVLTHFKWETMEVKTIFGPPYKCPSCEKEYCSFAFAREHCVSIHGFNATNTLIPKVFNNMRRKHLNIPHANNLQKLKAGVSTEQKESESTKKLEENNSLNKLTVAPESCACPICSKTFANQENKGTHVITHFEWENMQVKIIRGPPYICTSCGENHSTLSSIRAHCVSTHSFNVSNKSSFKFSRARKNPMKTKKSKIRKSVSTASAVKDASALEPQKEETFVCDVCGKVFQNKNALHGHQYCHRQERPFVCEKCGTAFKRANDFRRHKRVHYEKENGIRPQCDICGRTYISTFGLAKHKTNVHPQRNPIPPCTLCNKTFATRSYALKHIRKHRQQQPAMVDSNPPSTENITPVK